MSPSGHLAEWLSRCATIFEPGKGMVPLDRDLRKLVDSDYSSAEMERCSIIAERMFPPLKCPRCKGRGYTGYAEEPESIARALKIGVACSCPQGEWFSREQRMWIDV